MKKILLIIFVIALILILSGYCIFSNSQKAQAASYTSAISGNWLDDATWGGGGHPAAGDTAIITSGKTITFNGDDPAATTCAGITINLGGILTFAAGARTLTVKGAISVSGTLDQNEGQTIHLQQPDDTAGFTATYVDTTHIDLNAAWTVEAGWSYHYYHNTTDNEWRWATAAANNGGGNVRLTFSVAITSAWNGDAITQTHPIHNGLTVNSGGTYNAIGTAVSPITINTTSALVANTSSSFTTTSDVSSWLAGADIWIATTTSTRAETEKVDVVSVVGPVDGEYTVNFNSGDGAGGTILYDHASGALATNVTRDTCIRAETTDGYHNSFVYAALSSTTNIDWDYVDFSYLGAASVTNGSGVYLRIRKAQSSIVGSTFHHNYQGANFSEYDNNSVLTSNFYNNTSDGLYAIGIDIVTFSNNNFFNNGGMGDNIYGGTLIIYSSNYHFSNVSHGLRNRGSGTFNSNNSFANSSDGINTDGNNTTFDTNNAYYNGGKGLVQAGKGSVLTSNNLYNNTSWGLRFDGGDNNRAVSNNIHHNSGGGVEIYGNAYNNVLNSNEIYSNTGQGVGIRNTSNNNVLTSNNIYSNTSYGIYFASIANDNTFISNNIYSNSAGIYLYPVTTGNYFINNSFGVGGANTSGDITGAAQAGAKTATFLNNRFASTTLIDNSFINNSSSYVISKRHNQIVGETRFWGEKSLSSGTEKFNYADNTYEAGYSAVNTSAGTGNGTITNITTPNATTINEFYQAKVTTASGDNPTFTITRSGGVANPATLTLSGGIGTYIETTTGVSFTITDGSTDFVLDDVFVFGTYAYSADTNTQKKLYFVASDSSLNSGKSKLTYSGGASVQLVGGSGDNQSTLINKYDTGGITDDPNYTFIVRGSPGNPATINAQYYSFTGLDTSGLQIGADVTITSLAYGTFAEMVEGGSHLTFDAVNLTDGEAITNCVFDSSGSYDVTAANNSRIPFKASKRGNLNDNPDGASTIIWNPEIFLQSPDNILNPSQAPILKVNLNGLPAGNHTVNFYAREKNQPSDFMLVQIPDFNVLYTSVPPHPEIIATMTQWIVNNKQSNNILFATQVGDLTNDPTIPSEWNNTNAAMSLLDGVIPYGVLPGNHEFNADPGATNYNLRFPYTRYQNESWWGGHYGTDNNNNYELVTMSGNDYIIFHLGYGADDTIMAWVNGLLTTYTNRRAIISTHQCISDIGTIQEAGLEIYNHVLPVHNNVFAVLCGHGGREKSTLAINNRNVTYIEEGHAGDPNGYIKTYRFSATDDKIYVRTYSPSLDSYDPCADCEFSLDYETRGGFTQVGSVGGVSSGQDAALRWEGATVGTDYEWYAEITGGDNAITSAVWNFKADVLPPTPTTLPETGALQISLIILFSIGPLLSGLIFLLKTRRIDSRFIKN
jgi:hypothetical protein